MTEQQKQLKQFTFYELYEDILNCLNDTQAGKMANRICAYEFEDVEPTGDMTDNEGYSRIDATTKKCKLRQEIYSGTHYGNIFKFRIILLAQSVILPALG